MLRVDKANAPRKTAWRIFHFTPPSEKTALTYSGESAIMIASKELSLFNPT